MYFSPQNIVRKRTDDLRPYARNARTHSKQQVRQIADSIQRFGFTNPILVMPDNEVIAGHGRLEAAKLLGLETVPTLVLPHLSVEERRAYVLADNKLALNAGWDPALLAIEFEALVELDFNIEVTGFSMAEVDLVIEESGSTRACDTGDEPVELPVEPRTRPGDLWQLGDHRLLCGDARDPASYAALLGGEKADLIFTDPPYNMAPAVRGATGVKHRQFAMAAGEMTSDAFTAFLATTMGLCASHSRNGAIAFVCMDWRNMGELLNAGKAAFSELKNLCVWNKHSAGMGKFYRSKHELVFVFKVRPGKHVNNFGMGGKRGRYRTNVWDYAGVSGFRANRHQDPETHPTVKPLSLIEDAIRDCSQRNDLVLDVFAGSGTTLLASHRCGRRSRIIEYDPAFCDAIIKRFLRSGGPAPHLLCNHAACHPLAAGC